MKELIQLARAARQQAYVPYSSFRVGAALLTEEGKIFTGCNVENASYGLTICAERTAVVKAVSEGYRNFKAIAVVGDTEDFCFPCGACRQVLGEFNPQMQVIMANAQDETKTMTIEELAPGLFKAGDMPKFREGSTDAR